IRAGRCGTGALDERCSSADGRQRHDDPRRAAADHGHRAGAGGSGDRAGRADGGSAPLSAGAELRAGGLLAGGGGPPAGGAEPALLSCLAVLDRTMAATITQLSGKADELPRPAVLNEKAADDRKDDKKGGRELSAPPPLPWRNANSSNHATALANSVIRNFS